MVFCRLETDQENKPGQLLQRSKQTFGNGLKPIVMSGINLPPFYVGQRVVALENVDLWKKGDEFVVLGIKKSCCYWIIDVGITVPTVYTYFQCQICRRRENIKPRQVYWPMANCFAPVEEKFEMISYKEVIRKEKPITCSN